MTIERIGFIERVCQSILRGGRMTKFKGKTASIAPGMIPGLAANPEGGQASGLGAGLASVAGRLKARLGASVSPHALSMQTLAMACAVAAPMALTVTGANAGTCTETAAGSGVWTCSGPAGADVTQNPTPAAGGALDVSTGSGFGITTAAGNAINLTNTAAETNITFTDIYASGITGALDGITAQNLGTGALSLTASGTVTGMGDSGIRARNYGTDLALSANNVSGYSEGILAINFGSGALSLTASGDVTGTGGLYGIYARNDGSGALSLTASGNVTATGGYGIYANNAGTGLTLSANNVSGAYGIYASNVGYGALSLTASGTVTGTGGNGIFANNYGTDLTVNANNVTAYYVGISASNHGTGALSLTASGDVTSMDDHGIAARNYSSGTDLTVSANNVSGDFNVILARNYGSGALSLTASGDVTSTGLYGSGIDARNYGTDLTVSANNVSGNYYGIRAHNYGTGLTSVTTTGAVSGTTYAGIYATNTSAGTSLSIDARGAVTGGTNGIEARNNGTAGLTISAGGDVTGYAGDGINAYNSANDVTASTLITQAAGTTTTGSVHGINADNRGGSLTINAYGTTIGQTGNGINAINNGLTATNLTITANTVSGGARGIYARNNGTGATSVTTTGAVSGTSSDGIYAQNTGAGTSLSIDAQGAVTGGTNGIVARNNNRAGLTISVGGNVTGYGGYGIFTTNGAIDFTASTLINQAAGTTTTGSSIGIFATNSGGSMTINALGTTYGTARDGINARNGGPAATDLSITANTVTGSGGHGIYASHTGAGALTISVGGNVTGGGAYGDGISAYAGGNSTSILITQAAGTTTTGTQNGIRAYNLTGSQTINASGTTYGRYQSGIDAFNSAYAIGAVSGALTVSNGVSPAVGYLPSTTDMTITANIVTGATYGIRARNNGTGLTSVTTTGAVRGTGLAGIYASNTSNGTSLSIDAQSTVTGGTNGIEARNNGTAGLTISAGGNVTGNAGDGIYAFNSANDITASMLITQAAGTTTTGSVNGILANNNGGSLTINALGTSIGLGGRGIVATNQAGTTNLNLTANIASGSTDGIFARNFGTGALSLTTTGDVTGTGSRGIYARNDGTDLTLSANANNVSGGSDGIYARSFGSGALSLTSSGNVTGTNRFGIFASNYYGTDLSVTANTVSGGTYGIRALNSGTGALSLTASGNVTGTIRNGIYARNSSAGTSLSINAQGAVTGGSNGIEARNYGTGALTITSQAAVTGDTGYGIRTFTGAGGNTTITLNAGAAVSSTAGLGISNDAGNSATTVNAGASVAGAISLTNGSDDLTFAGGDFSGVSLFDGGDDFSVADGFIDTLSFAGSSGALTGANVVNWESVVIGAGSTMSFSDNALTAGTLAINGGGTLNAFNGPLAFTSNMVNNGTINAQDGATNDSINVSGDFTGTGVLMLDVNLETDTADTLVVGGNVTGSTTLAFNNLGGVSTGNDILVVSVAGTSGAGDFTLAGGTLDGGNFTYNLGQVGNDFFLRTGGFGVATPSFEVFPQVLLSLNSLSTLHQRMPERSAAGDSGVVSRSIGGSGTGQTGRIWGRIEGALANMDANTTTTGSSYDLNQWKVRAGVDAIAQEGDSGTLLIGLNGFYGTADADITSATGRGSVNTDGFGVGLSATWFGTTGYYADAQAQLSWFNSDLSDPTTGVLANNNDGTGQAFSLEAGRMVNLSNGWVLTPQAQLSYSTVDFDSFTSGGAVVSLVDGDSLKGRVGFDLEQSSSPGTAADGSAVSSTFYGLANLYYEFSGKTQVNVTGVGFSNRADRLSGEIGVGGSYNWAGKYTVFGEVSTATSLESFGNDSQLKGTIGISVEF